MIEGQQPGVNLCNGPTVCRPVQEGRGALNLYFGRGFPLYFNGQFSISLRKDFLGLKNLEGQMVKRINDILKSQRFMSDNWKASVTI